MAKLHMANPALLFINFMCPVCSPLARSCCRPPDSLACRPILHSFQVTTRRGASVLLHVAAGNRDIFSTGVKYVMAHGKVAAAKRGVLLPRIDLTEARVFETELQGLLRQVRDGKMA